MEEEAAGTGGDKPRGKVGVGMAKRSKQTFRKRQRELAKKRKKEAKAERLAARRGDKTGEDDETSVENNDKVDDSRMTGEGKILKIRLVGSKHDG